MSQQINLFNPVFLKQKKYFSVVTMLQALGLIVLGSGVFYAYAMYQVKLLTLQSEETAKRYASEQVRFANYATEFSPERSQLMLTEELKSLESQLASQTELIDTLKTGVIGNTEGYSEYMRAFARQSVDGLWLTGFDIAGDGAEMNLHGGAQSGKLLPSYIRRLNKEPIMRGKTFAAMKIDESKDAAARGYIVFALHSNEVAGDKKP